MVRYEQLHFLREKSWRNLTDRTISAFQIPSALIFFFFFFFFLTFQRRPQILAAQKARKAWLWPYSFDTSRRSAEGPEVCVPAWLCLKRSVRRIGWRFWSLERLPCCPIAVLPALLHGATAVLLLLWRGDSIVDRVLETVVLSAMGSLYHVPAPLNAICISLLAGDQIQSRTFPGSISLLWWYANVLVVFHRTDCT